jgi:hypothetical protein
MSNSEEPNHALAAFHRREMDLFERMVGADITLGVPATLHYCSEHGLPVPEWLVKAALDLLCDLLKREVSTKRGRSGGAVARYHQDMIDMTRWNEICVLREKQQLVHESISMYEDDTSITSTSQFAAEVARAEWLGRTLSRAFECASDLLERTEAFGSPESIKRSYRVVKRDINHPVRAFRYHMLDPNFLQKVGIEHDLSYGRRGKIAPWRQKPSSPPKARKRLPRRARPVRDEVSRVT